MFIVLKTYYYYYLLYIGSAGTINCQIHNSDYSYVFNEDVTINPLCDVEITSAEVKPDLPSDLHLEQNGMISGTIGSVKTTKVMYTVTLASTTGEGYTGSYSVYITVNEPIQKCDYHVATFVFVRNYWNTYLSPECNSQMVKAVAKSGMPLGIQLNSTTGAMYGITTDNSGSSNIVITFTGLGNREIDVTFPIKVIGPDDQDSIMTAGLLLRIKDGTNWNQWRSLWKELDTADTTYEFNSLSVTDYECGETGACPASNGKLLNYFIKYISTLKVEETGTYLFSCNADDNMVFFIDDMETPKAETTFWTMTATVTTSLTAGWHPIGIMTRQGDGGHGLHLKWKKDGSNGDFVTIGSDYLRYIPTPIQHVSYFSDSFIAYSDQQFTSKPTIQGYATTVVEAGTTKLSELDLTVAPTTGTITGTPTTTIDDRLKNILLKFGNSVSDYGTFDVPLTFQIIKRNKNSVVSGLRANYYKSSYRSCEWREIDESIDTLSYSRVDTSIQHPTSNNVWDELTADFQEYFTVEWTGVIIPPTAGTYTITISADTGARLELNNTIITTDSGSCSGGIKTATGKFYLTDDVNTIRIVYWKAGGSTSKTFQISWSSSTIPTPVAISSSYFGRLPTKPFNYHYDTATYVSGVTIPDNCPIFKNDNDKNQYTKYSIDPPLPNGLGLNSEHCISGTPSGSYSLLDYKIIASNNDGTVQISTTVKIQVRRVSVPTKFEYPSSGIIATIGNKVLLTPILDAPEDSLITFMSDPSLPTGLYFDESGTISGYPTVSFTGTITITAVNEAGSINADISVTISDCGNGGNFVALKYQVGDPEVDITITGNDEVLYIKTTQEHIVDTFYQSFFCSPSSSINIEIRSVAKRGGVITITGYDNILFRKFTYGDGESSKTYTIPVIVNGEPEITYPSQITASLNEEIRIYPTNINNGITRFEIGLLLPLGLNLNRTSGEIYGYPTESGVFDSKIVGYNIYNQMEQSTEAHITFRINSQCDGNDMLLTVEADASPTSIYSVLRVKSYSSNSYLIDYDSLTQSSNYRYSKCVSQSTLLFTYGSSKSGSNSVTYRIYRQGVLIDTLSSNTITETSVIFVLAIDSSNEWEYSSSVSNDDWKTTTGGWSKAKPGSFPDRTTIATYYRTTFDASGIDLTSLLKFQLSITYEAGIVVFINGKEFYRRNFNVNVGTITSTTEPNRVWATANTRALYGHSRLLNADINYIAVEIHRKSGNANAKETFRCELLYDTKGNGVNFLMPSVDITSQNNLWFSTNTPGDWNSWQTGTECFRKLFDQNVNTKWSVAIPSATDGLRIRYSWFDGTASLIDDYVIATANDCIGRDPKRWVVEGLRQFDNADWTWEKITEVNDTTALPGTPTGVINDGNQANTRNKYIYFKVPNPKDYVYEAVRLSIFEMKKPNDGECGNAVQLSEFNVRNQYSLTCPSQDGYIETVIGHTARAVCDNGYEGVKTRICNNDGVWGDEDKTGCTAGSEATRIDYIPQIVEGNIGVSIEPMIAVPNGIVISYSISPKLPDGLSINPTSGIISGISSEEIERKTFRVTGTTLTSKATANVIITIKSLKCESKTEFGKTYPEMPVGGIRIGKCNVGYSGYSTSVCVLTVSGPKWGPWDTSSNCDVGVSANCQLTNDIETKVNGVVNQVISCTNTPTTVSVDPYLPNALDVSISGNSLLISGVANIASNKQTYTINATFGNTGYDLISFDLSVYDTITNCQLGFSGSLPLTLNIETTIIPAECNALVTSYSSNNLPSGFTINPNTGYITGTPFTPFTGSITVTVSNPSNSFQYQIPIRISEDSTNLAGLEGYVTNEGQGQNYITILDQFNSGGLTTNKLSNMPENIASLHVSEKMIWPGPYTRNTNYWVIFKGYINIKCAGTYYMYVAGDDKVVLFIDDMINPQYTNPTWNGNDAHNYTFTLGPHEIMIMYFNGNSIGNIDIKWRCGECGINILTPLEDSLFSHGSLSPLQRITYPVNDIILIKGIDTGEIKPTIVGEVTSWKLDKDTPPGVVFKDGIFSGIPTEAYPRRQYTITATNVVTATVSVYLGTLDNSTNTMAKGLVGKYYSGVISSCNAIAVDIIPEGNTLRFERIEVDGLNFDETVSVWKGLSGEFQNSYIAYWSGYLYVQETATFSFTLTCEDWCRLHIYNTGTYYTAQGCGIVTKDVQITINQGFQFFGVSYGKTNSGRTKSFSISWSQDTGNFQFDKKILDNNYLFHKPESYLEYTYKKARYISNVDIQRNSPLFISADSSSYKSFTIKPALPSGLSIDPTTGDIYGKSTLFSVANTIYTITATSSTGLEPLTTKIEFSVEPRYVPSDLVYPDITGQIGQQLYIMSNGVKVTSIIPSIVNGVSIFYQLESDLPKGLSFDPSTGGISGTPLEIFNGKVTVSASNPSGSIQVDVNINIVGCSDGKVFQKIDYTIGSGDVSVVLASENGLKYYEKQAPLNPFRSYSYIACAIAGVNILNFTTGSSSLFGGSYVISVDGSVVKAGFYEGKGNTRYSFQYNNLIQQGIPSITYDTKRSLIYGEDLKFSLNVINGCKKFILTEPIKLPEGISFDSESGLISGSSDKLEFSPQYSFTVECSNDYGTSSPYKITLDNLANCDNEGTFFKLKFTTQQNGNDMIVKMRYYTTQSQLFSLVNALPDYSETTLEFCAIGGIYEVEYGSATSSKWPSKAKVEILMDSSVLYTFQLEEDKASKTERVTLANYARESSLWWFGNTEPETDLYKYELDPKLFTQRLRANQFPPRLSTTNYYALEFYYNDDVKQIYALAQTVTYDAGIIMYLNGKEFYRKYLPSGYVNYNTRATKKFETILPRTVSAAQILINNGYNYLVVETHKHRSSQTLDPFKMSASPTIFIGDNCWGRTDMSGMYGRTNRPDISYEGEYGQHKAVDYVIDTYLKTTFNPGETVELEWWYYNEKAEFFSRFDIYTGVHNGNYVARSFKLYGATDHDDPDYELLLDVPNVNNGQWAVTQSRLPDNYKSYHIYKVVIPQTYGLTNGKYELRIPEIRAVSCTLTYCPAEGIWPLTASRYTATMKCNGVGESGYIKRTCSASTQWENEDRSACKPSATTINYNALSTLDFPIGYEKSYLLTSNGGVNRYTIKGDLPTGVSFNSETGEISGKSTSKLTSTCVVSAIVNADEYPSVTITITSDYITCIEQDGYKQVNAFEESYKLCDEGYDGYKKRICSEHIPGQWGNEITSGCIMKKPRFSFPQQHISVSRQTYYVIKATAEPIVPSSYSIAFEDGTDIASSGISISNDGTITFNTATEFNAKVLKVTGTNSGGSTTVDLLVSSFSMDGTIFQYPAGVLFQLSKNVEVTTDQLPSSTVSVIGGFKEVQASPNLPTGLQISPITGMVYGTAIADSLLATYTVTAINHSGKSISAGSFSLSVTTKYCTAATNYTQAEAGDYSKRDCPHGYKGSLYRYCPLKPYPLFEDEVNNCTAINPISFTYPNNGVFTLTVGIDVVEVVPIIEGNINTVTFIITSGELPEGLYLEKNGKITGAPISESTTRLTIQAKDTDPIETSLTLTIVKAYCESTSQCQRTEAGGLCTKPCGTGMDGLITIRCSFSATPEWMDEDSTSCVALAPDSFTYPMMNQLPFYVGMITSYTPTYTGGKPDKYEVTKGSIPDGITFDPKNGMLIGSTQRDGGPYTFTVTASNSRGSKNAEVSVTFIIAKCLEEDGFEETIAGGVATKKCPGTTEVGEIVRECPREPNPKWGPIINRCKEGDPIIEYPFKLLTVYIDVPFKMEISKVQGNPTEYEVDGDLPPGITVNPDDGTVSGTVKEIGQSTSYVVYVYATRNLDSARSNRFLLSFDIDRFTCAGEGSWPSANYGYNSAIFCNSNYTGIQTRSCSSYKLVGDIPVGQWGKIDDSKCILNEELLEPPNNEVIVSYELLLPRVAVLDMSAQHYQALQETTAYVLTNISKATNAGVTVTDGKIVILFDTTDGVSGVIARTLVRDSNDNCEKILSIINKNIQEYQNQINNYIVTNYNGFFSQDLITIYTTGEIIHPTSYVPENDEGNGTNIGLIIGLVIAAAAVLLIVGGCIYCRFVEKVSVRKAVSKKKKQMKVEEEVKKDVEKGGIQAAKEGVRI